MFSTACVFAAVRLVFSVTLALKLRTTVSYLEIPTWFLITLMHLVVHTLGKRFRQRFMPMVAILFVLTNLLSIITLEIALSFDQDKAASFNEFRRDVVIYSSISLLLLAPSIKYVLFCYVPVTLITSSIAVIRHEMDMTIIPYFVLSQILLPSFWYIFQKRELKRFFEQ